MQDAALLRTGFVNSVYQFNHVHFWFLSLLLLFFIVFTLLNRGIHHRSESLHSEIRAENQSNKSIFTILVLVSVMTAVLTLFMFWLFTKEPGREPWVIIASIVQFQPTRVCLYGICFGLGIYSYRKNWFANGKPPGNLMFWIVFTLTLWFTKEMILSNLIKHFTLTLGVLHETIRAFLVFSIIMTLIAFGGKHWQSASRFNRSLAKNSYTIYLIHLVIVFVIQLLMYKWWDLSIYTKFVIGSVSSLLLSYLFSEFIVRRYPRSSIGGLVSMFALLAFILN
jgi:Na+/H+ antiporter NhaC